MAATGALRRSTNPPVIRSPVLIHRLFLSVYFGSLLLAYTAYPQVPRILADCRNGASACGLCRPDRGVCDHAGMNDTTGNTTRDTTDRATRHDGVTVNEAAVALGITPDSVRARLRRGSLGGEKIGPGWYVFLNQAPAPSATERDEDRATRHDTPRDATRQRDTTTRDTDRDELLEELRRDKIFLQEQLDRALRQLEAERQRADVLQALGTGTTSDTSPEAVASSETNETEPHGFWDRVRRFWSG